MRLVAADRVQRVEHLRVRVRVRVRVRLRLRVRVRVSVQRVAHVVHAAPLREEHALPQRLAP